MPLLNDTIMFTGLIAILGLMVGSFLNVVIHRLPKMLERDWQRQCAELRGEPPPQLEPLSLSSPRSHCPTCGHVIAPLENIPVFSYLLLGGRCRSCASPISIRYPVVEGLTALLSGFVAWHFGYSWQALGALLLVWSIVSLAFIDLDTQLLPDTITIPLLWIGLLFNLSGTYTDLASAFIGAIAGYLTLWTVYWLFKLATGKEGMGYGDFKLLAALGAWLGWQILPLIILLSSLVGAAVGVILIVVAKQSRSVPIPFGPYLALAGMIALFWGRPLTQTYLQLL